MNKLFYPAVFQAEEHGYFVSFPDIDGCLTQGDSIEDCYNMAVEALGLMLSYMEENHQPIPKASLPQDIPLNENQFVVLIQFDMLAYKKKYSSKSVKKTLSIPEWINEEACSLNINFSQTLQEALLEKINK